MNKLPPFFSTMFFFFFLSNLGHIAQSKSTDGTKLNFQKLISDVKKSTIVSVTLCDVIALVDYSTQSQEKTGEAAKTPDAKWAA